MNSQSGRNITPQPFVRGAPVVAVLKGIVLALALSVVLLFIAALVLYFTAVPEKITPYLVFGISIIAIMAGSFSAGKSIGSRGWLYGGITGFVFVVLMLVGGLFVLDDLSPGWNFATKLFLGFIFGAVGGMWGVNR
ncbi:MAG TPA: TIGR04086 family membrane protein [Bacillota bacterium]|nr:TIGR04086 family membrane protein [Bacillota bacterium]